MDINTPHYTNHIDDGLYDTIVNQLIALTKGVSLGDATYKEDFI
jgi:hypothetical protein